MIPLVFNTTLNVINRLLSQLNLKWEEGYLVYYYKLNYDVVEIEISPDFKDVLKILGLPSGIGSNIEYDAHLLATSRFFNWKVLKKNRLEIQSFLDVLRDSNYKSSYRTKTEINSVKTIKKYLNIDISYLRYTIIPSNYSYGEIRNKFNGYLVTNWLNLPKRNNTIDSLIDEFKKHIRKVDYEIFDYYLYNSTPKQIMNDFKKFSLLFSLPKRDIELPF